MRKMGGRKKKKGKTNQFDLTELRRCWSRNAGAELICFRPGQLFVLRRSSLIVTGDGK